MMTRKPRSQIKEEAVAKLKDRMGHVSAHGVEIENCIEARGYLNGLYEAGLFHCPGGEYEFKSLRNEVNQLIESAQDKVKA